jgi:hypothetical protein
MLLILAAVLAAMVVAPQPTTSGAGSHGAVVGTATLTDARGELFDAPGVELTLTCGRTPDQMRVATSDEHGAFRFADLPDDRCSISADLQGFAKVTAAVTVHLDETLNVTIHLDAARVDARIRVVGGSPTTFDRQSCVKRCGR